MFKEAWDCYHSFSSPFLLSSCLLSSPLHSCPLLFPNYSVCFPLASHSRPLMLLFLFLSSHLLCPFSYLLYCCCLYHPRHIFTSYTFSILQHSLSVCPFLCYIVFIGYYIKSVFSDSSEIIMAEIAIKRTKWADWSVSYFPVFSPKYITDCYFFRLQET